MTNSVQLNPYKIFWGIVEITNGKLTANQAKNIAKISGSGLNLQKGFFFFHGSESSFEERFNNVVANLAYSGTHGNVYKITDKQFGMIINNWNGIVPECPKPFNHSVIFKDGNQVTLVPLTEDQFKNGILF